MDKQLDLLQGTLDMLVLKAVSLGPLHGYGVLLRIQQISKGTLEIQQGSLYPALYPLARRKRVSLAEIADRGPCVEFRPGTELRRHVDAAFLSAGLSRSVAFELGQLTEMVRFARAGLGTAIVPRSFTADLAPRSRTVGVLALADGGMAITIGAYIRSEAARPAARALLDVASGRDELRREFA